MAQLLTAADVQRLIANPSVEARAETAVKVAERTNVTVAKLGDIVNEQGRLLEAEQMLSGAIPNCRSYDPTFGFEVAVIPPNTPCVGFDHWPCMMFLPGRLAREGCRNMLHSSATGTEIHPAVLSNSGETVRCAYPPTSKWIF